MSGVAPLVGDRASGNSIAWAVCVPASAWAVCVPATGLRLGLYIMVKRDFNGVGRKHVSEMKRTRVKIRLSSLLWWNFGEDYVLLHGELAGGM